jgi:Family of unknown function (DUF6141)
VTFEESQRFRQPWLLAIVGGAAALLTWMFVYQVVLGHPLGDRPAPDGLLVVLWIVVGVLVPFLFARMRLVTTVEGSTITARFVPRIGGVTIDAADVASAEATEYRPIRQFGGWGVRWGGPRRWAFNVSGNRGVLVELHDGRSYLIGSQRPHELVSAIRAAMSVD